MKLLAGVIFVSAAMIAYTNRHEVVLLDAAGDFYTVLVMDQMFGKSEVCVVGIFPDRLRCRKLADPGPAWAEKYQRGNAEERPGE